jgi:hypothetical protein
MNVRSAAAAACLLLLFLPAMAPALSPVVGPLRVFLICGADTAAIGDSVNFTVCTFLKGEAVTLERPPAVTLSSDSGAAERPVPVHVAGPGRYDGALLVLAADVDGSNRLTLTAAATYEGLIAGEPGSTDSDSAGIYVNTPSTSPAEVQFSGYLFGSSDSPVRPGTTLTILCCATLEGRPVDPTDLVFTMGYNGPNPVVPYQKMGTGSYRLKFTVPKIRENDRFSLYYHYNLTKANSYGGYAGASFSVNFFTVLYHELKRNGTRIDFEVLVSDVSGAPARGKSVTVTASPTGGQPEVTLDLGKTDQSGRVKGFFDFGPDVRYANIRGWANDSRHSQSFNGHLRLADAPYNYLHSDGSFSLVPLGQEGSLTPGAWANLSFRAYDLGEPVSNETVECYVKMYSSSDRDKLSTSLDGRLIATDGGGYFNLNLTFPSNNYTTVEVFVVGPREVPDANYLANWDYYFIDVQNGTYPQSNPEPPGWNASFSRAVPGRSCKVTVTAPEGGLAAGTADWSITVNSTGGFTPWAVWSSFETLLVGQNGTTFKGQLVLPRQLAPGMNLTVQVYLQNASGVQSDFSVPLRVKAAVAATSGPDLCCITSIFVVNIVLIGLLFFNYIAARRKPGRNELENLGVDERIDEVLRASGGGQPGLTLPIKVEMALSEDCMVCGRRIARGNLALRCVCGGRFHEHCTGDGSKCPSCGREWKKS